MFLFSFFKNHKSLNYVLWSYCMYLDPTVQKMRYFAHDPQTIMVMWLTLDTVCGKWILLSFSLTHTYTFSPGNRVSKRRCGKGIRCVEKQLEYVLVTEVWQQYLQCGAAIKVLLSENYSYFFNLLECEKKKKCSQLIQDADCLNKQLTKC